MNANALLLGALLATTTTGTRPAGGGPAATAPTAAVAVAGGGPAATAPAAAVAVAVATDAAATRETPPHEVTPAARGVVTADPDLVPKAFVILKTTVSYADARAAAATAAETLAIRMDLRELTPDRTIGLTRPEADCIDEFGSFPCYVPRGRWDDGVYLSVEHTGSYQGFDDNQYIVVLASGAPHDRALRAALSRAKSAYPSAFVKTIPVYLGCIH